MVTQAPARSRQVNRVGATLDAIAALREFDDELARADRRLKATERHIDPNILVWAINFMYVTFPDARGEVEGWSVRQIVAFATDLL